MAQVAINWVRWHGAVPLVGCRCVKQLEDAAGSMDWDLKRDEAESLDKLSLGLSLFERPLYRRGLFSLYFLTAACILRRATIQRSQAIALSEKIWKTR